MIEMEFSNEYHFIVISTHGNSASCSNMHLKFFQVFFYIDPEFETDPKMVGVNNIVLSYTFFKVKE